MAVNRSDHSFRPLPNNQLIVDVKTIGLDVQSNIIQSSIILDFCKILITLLSSSPNKC